MNQLTASHQDVLNPTHQGSMQSAQSYLGPTYQGPIESQHIHNVPAHHITCANLASTSADRNIQREKEGNFVMIHSNQAYLDCAQSFGLDLSSQSMVKESYSPSHMIIGSWIDRNLPCMVEGIISNPFKDNMHKELEGGQMDDTHT